MSEARTHNRRLAVVAATAGGNVGGAELVLRRLADGLAGRGWEVDLLTTAAEDTYTWANVAPIGVAREGDLTVRRFPAVGLTQPQRDALSGRILWGERLSKIDEYRWINAGMRVPELYDYLADHAGEYRALICGPYQFWMALVLADLAPARTILVPCLHDEPFARLDVHRYQMTSVRGLWMLSEPERDLAADLGLLGERVAVVGSGLDEPPAHDVDGFRARHGIEGDFVLFAGRREWGKGWPQLVQDLTFASGELRQPVPLVTCGAGDVGEIPEGLPLVDLGLVEPAERTAAQAAATACIQPSAMESFSLTVLEAFQLGTPVFANDASAVVRWHCARSGAGITYRNRYELAECLRLVQTDRALLERVGEAGPAYVRENFGWDGVLDRAEASLEAWT